jgi:hypothetical protein
VGESGGESVLVQFWCSSLMPPLTITIQARIRGLWIARTVGRLPGPLGRWARCHVRVETRIGRGPWEEIGHWTEPS